MMKRERQYEILADRCPGIGTEQEYRYILTVSSEALDKKGMTFEEFEAYIPQMKVYKDFSLTDGKLCTSKFIYFFWEMNGEYHCCFTEHWYEYMARPFGRALDMEGYLKERQERVDYVTSKEFRDKILNYMKNELPVFDPDHETDEELFCEFNLWANGWDCAEEKVLEWKRIEQG